MKIIDLEIAEKMPFHQSMRKSSIGFNDDDYDDYYWMSSINWKFIYRFIKKHVGKNYDAAYAEFLKSLKKFHYCEYINNEAIRHFKHLFTGSYAYFDIDDNDNIIWSAYRTRHKDKDIHLYTENADKKYKLKSAAELIQKFGYETYRYIELTIGYKLINYLQNNYLTQNVLDKYWYKIYNAGDKAFTKFKKPDVNRYNRQYYSADISDFFNIEYVGDEIILKYRSPEYTRYIAEKWDMQKKIWRIADKKKKEIEETLLYRIEYDREKDEKAVNNEKIIRHGFDIKTSFRNFPVQD